MFASLASGVYKGLSDYDQLGFATLVVLAGTLKQELLLNDL